MNNDAGGILIFLFIFLAMAIGAGFAIGYPQGQTRETSIQREKFIIFCTGKNETYETCDHIFKGEKTQ